jgi:hypothetical protein
MYQIGSQIVAVSFDKMNARLDAPAFFQVVSAEQKGKYSKMVLRGIDLVEYVAERDTSNGVTSWGLWIKEDYEDQAPLGVTLARDYRCFRYATTYFKKVLQVK